MREKGRNSGKCVAKNHLALMAVQAVYNIQENFELRKFIFDTEVSELAL
jgi:hypothetical protein